MKTRATILGGGVRRMIPPACAAVLVLGTILAGVLPAAAQRLAAPRQVLSGHVLPILKNLQSSGLPAPTNQMAMAIGLPLHNQAALDQFLTDLYDPASPKYQQYLTPEEFTESFGPTAADYAAVRAFATAHGLTVTATYSNRMLLDVIGSVADVEAAFNVTMRLYPHPTESRDFYAPDREPSVPMGLPVLDVSGMNNYRLAHPKLRIPNQNTVKKGKARAGSGMNGNYIGADFRKAYAPDVTLTGNGQVVGLFQADGYDPADIAAYAKLAGFNRVPPLENVLIDGFNGIPTGTGGEVEVSLDIEMVMSMAPGISRIILYEGNPFNYIPNDILNAMTTANAARQLSCSWGWSGGPSATTDQIFKQMATQGQTFFDASGDIDAFLPGAVDDPNVPNAPSDNPYITQVGGTTLTTDGTQAWQSETVWNWGISIDPVLYDGVGSSGGISAFYSLPTWQGGINMTNNLGSTTFRNIPDVAMTGDNVLVVADSGLIYLGVGGTSCASPLWGGFTALVNQRGATMKKKSVGFLNPAIYAVGAGPFYSLAFHDITTGNNAWSQSPTNFPAVAGYDLCTGWGTPRGQALINLLLGLPPGCAPDGILEVGITPADGSTLLAGSTNSLLVSVADSLAVTNATVTASINGGAPLTLLDNGAAPDVKAGDGTYSGPLIVPGAGPMTVTVIVSAPGEVSSTNVVSYNVVPVPTNDYFTNSTKVPPGGAVYLSNNQMATTEAGEPILAAFASAAGSLWWSWSPSATTNVLIDTAGSANNAVVAIYTGNTLDSLVPLGSAGATATQPHTFLEVSVTNGATYHIVLASANKASLGSFRLAIVPGGQADTNAPSAQVTAPLSGLWVTNNLITVSGTAADDIANFTGISQVLVSANGGCTLIASGTTNWSVSFGLTPGLNSIVAVAEDLAGNLSAPVTVQVTYVLNNPANDLFAAATPSTNSSGTVSASTVNATKELGEPFHAGNSGGKSVWWVWQAPADGVLSLSTSNSTFDTLLGLYTGTRVDSLTTIAANDDAFAGAPGGFSEIDQAVRAGQTYHIAVDGFGGVGGAATLHYSFTAGTVYQLSAASSGGGSIAVTVSNALGGVQTVPGGSGDVPANATVVLTGIPNVYYQFDSWSGDTTSSDNPLVLTMTGDMNISGNFLPGTFTDDFESGDLTHIAWMTAGDAPWFVQSSVVASGSFAAQSGVIGNGQSSSLLLTTNFSAGTGAFYFKVSSETNFDTLTFLVDGGIYAKWSGEVAWNKFTFPLTSGTHTLEWRYSKDPSISTGLDAGFLDNVNLPVAATADSSTAQPPSAPPAAAHLGLVPQANGTFIINLAGQSNGTYILQTSGDLIHWQNLSTNTVSGGSVQVPAPASVSTSRFYRAVGAQ